MFTGIFRCAQTPVTLALYAPNAMFLKEANKIKKAITEIKKLTKNSSRVVIAIDGRGGAGKSSLARKIIEKIPDSFHIEYDWFHLPKQKVINNIRFDNERLIKEVLIPFSSKQKELKFKKYNWGYVSDIEDGFEVETTTVQSKDILIIEGCESINSTLLPFIDFSIWLDTNSEESLRRVTKRDIEEYKLDPVKVNDMWQEWVAWEREILAKDDRRLKANIII